MDEYQNQVVSGGGQPPSASEKKPRKRITTLVVIAAIALFVVVVAVLVVLMVMKNVPGAKDKNTSTTQNAANDEKAATKLFDSLGKAASQPNIRVAQLRKTYATKADLTADTDPGVIQSSVGEVIAQKFRGLYAQRLYDKETFNMERCLDGTAYVDGLGGSGAGRAAPKTLAEANEYLKQMYRSSDLSFTVCGDAGVMDGAPTDLAQIRLSDGLLPVTLTEQQATNWKNKVKAANLLAVKDEGMVEHGGKQLHKYSFQPTGDGEGLNTRLYDIFYETGEIDKIKRDFPGAKWAYEFIAVNPANGGGVKGFYLIDDATGLPAYSELQGVNQDRAKNRPIDKANLGFNKQSFSYPAAPTIELTTPLEFLQ